jgi:hypothetical protein
MQLFLEFENRPLETWRNDMLWLLMLLLGLVTFALLFGFTLLCKRF